MISPIRSVIRRRFFRTAILARAAAPVLLCWACCSALAQTPHWIWSAQTNTVEPQTVYLRKSFRIPLLTWNSRLTLSADDSAEVFLNGVLAARCDDWESPVRGEVTVRLSRGDNVLAVRARNRTGPAGVLVSLNLGGETNLVSDTTWLVSTNEEAGWTTVAFNAADWSRAHSFGTNGVAPWDNVLARGSATPAESIKVPPGFKVELLRSAAPNEGSWICMAFDPKGRLVLSAQSDDSSLLRLTLSSNRVTRVERQAAPVTYAMGLLFGHDSLYANARGPEETGLYRLRDLNADDRYGTNEVELLQNFSGSGEHGYHALALGPDKRIYVLNGNGTRLLRGLSAHSPYRNYGEDSLSLNPDETSKAGGARAPAGRVLRTDAEGAEWELVMGGLRNSYDFDFSPDGELFTFDSDMEWDWGTAWYRATRIVHCVSGGENGWRDGTRMWAEHYEDSLPAVVEAGIGSPTAVKFGTRSHFPEKYRRALFAQDWSYGRIFAIHLEPQGASYSAKVETFLEGAPLNLTAMAFGPDGALYFITGGRATQSGLYRVSFTGQSQHRQRADVADSGAGARALRQKLERFHGRPQPGAVEEVWPHLGSADRFIRFAARVALEAQPVASWQARALAERSVDTALTALLALARVGERAVQPALWQALAKFPLDSLDEARALRHLRVVQVSFLRQGRPTGELAADATEKLNRRYPAQSWALNRELSRLLLYLEAPSAISKTLVALEQATMQEEQFHYVAQLRHVRVGWTIPDRRRYFEWWLRPREKLQHPPELIQWFADVGRTYVDGAWIDKYLRQFRADAIATLPPEDKAQLAALIARPFEKGRIAPTTSRTVVREWTMNDIAAELDRVGGGRNFSRGRQAFVDAQCLSCHRFGNDGGFVGPELTAVGSKYDRRALLESMLDPSKAINEQYQNTTVSLKDGEMVTGRIVLETEQEVVIETDPLNGVRQEVGRAEIKSRQLSPMSSMPEGLLNIFTKEEIFDLLAYLESGGRATAPVFQK